MTNARMVLAFLLAGCGMPATIGDAASEVGADAVLPDSTTRPCVPACPSEQTCVDGACFTPVLQRLAFTLADPQQLAVGQMLPFRVSAVYSNSEMRDVSINAMLSLSEQTSVRMGPIVNDRPSLLGVAIGEATLTARYAGTQSAVRIVVGSDPRLVGVQVDPATITVPAGGRGEARLLARFMDGTMPLASGVVAWRSSDPNLLETVGSVATVVLRASARGTVTITGSLGGFSSTATVTIR